MRNVAVDGEEIYADDLRGAITLVHEGPSLFAGLDHEEIRLCAGRGTLITCVAGDQILRRGGTATNPFLVVSGRLEARRDGCFIRELQPGDLFGEAGWLGHQDRRVDVFVTEDDSRILSLGDRNLVSRREAHPSIAIKLLTNVSEMLWSRLRDADALSG